ncbi:MAG: hypothetical protein Udaeo2_12820 [Candidatus Udaeobacter sp.]|nr:MAG: hypothetical protein Udaeo2_12820 [Candidatus Udaeobacter sp.]
MLPAADYRRRIAHRTSPAPVRSARDLNSNLVRASLRQIGRDPPDRTPHERDPTGPRSARRRGTGSDLLWDLALAGLVVPDIRRL